MSFYEDIDYALNEEPVDNYSMDATATELLLQRMLNLKRSEAFRRMSDGIVYRFMLSFAVLGCIAVIVNVCILSLIIAHHKRLYKNMFYILVTNFTCIDTLRGICLIMFSWRVLKPEHDTSSIRISLMKMDQIGRIFLKFCNIATILNLLMITLNEWIFVRFPFRYYKFVSKRRVTLLIIISSIASAIYVILETFVESRFAAPRIYVPVRNASSTADYKDPFSPGGNQSSSSSSIKVMMSPGFAVHLAFNIFLLTFCFLCLAIILICYISFARVVRHIQKQDKDLEKSIRRPSECSIGSLEGAGPADEKRFRKQLLRRHKYAIVIGLVIVIYSLYLFSYSSIQVLHLIMFSNIGGSKAARSGGKKALIIRLLMQLLFGLHAILQPLCYLRMQDFRTLILASLRAISTCCRDPRTASGSQFFSTTEAEPSGYDKRQSLTREAGPSTRQSIVSDKPPIGTTDKGRRKKPSKGAVKFLDGATENGTDKTLNSKPTTPVQSLDNIEEVEREILLVTSPGDDSSNTDTQVITNLSTEL